MGTVIQAQEIIEKASKRSAKSVTPLIPGYPWHQRRSDFYAICGGDWVAADALRVLENVTNKLIERLRGKYRIPEDHLPHKDDLWISEMRLDDFASLSVHSTARSSYARCLHEISAKESKPSLVQLRFLSVRFVAWAGIAPELPGTTIYLGRRDKREESFIVVDANGEYIDNQGMKRSAIEEGWTAIEKQFRYEFEAVNKALWRLIGQSPPTPLKRWKSLQKRKVATEETTKSTLGSDQNSSQTSATGGPCDDEIEQGTKSRLLFENKNNIDTSVLSLENSKNRLSFAVLHNNSVSLHSAPWCAETVIALASHHLAVPDINTIDEQQWLHDWLEPAQWLIEHTSDLDCSRAWEIIELHIAAMIAGPTWHARKANKPFTDYGTLRHVVGSSKKNVDLDGHNWIATAKALEAERWADYVHIDYRGPSLFDEQSAQSSSAQADQSEQSYEQGYAPQSVSAAQIVDGSAQTLDNNEQPAQSIEVVAQVEEDTAQIDAQPALVVEVVAGEECADDQVSNEQSMSAAQDEDEAAQPVRDTEALEVIAQPEEPAQSEEAAQYYTGTELALQIIEGDVQGMTSLVAARLRTLIRRDYPDILIVSPKIDGYCLVALQIAVDTWYYLGSLDDWNRQSSETQEAVIDAEAYARQRQATNSNVDSQGPPGGELNGGSNYEDCSLTGHDD